MSRREKCISNGYIKRFINTDATYILRAYVTIFAGGFAYNNALQ